ncbi:unnamed protein product [Discosporangium mesarthrocarpum]
MRCRPLHSWLPTIVILAYLAEYWTPVAAEKRHVRHGIRPSISTPAPVPQDTGHSQGHVGPLVPSAGQDFSLPAKIRFAVESKARQSDDTPSDDAPCARAAGAADGCQQAIPTNATAIAICSLCGLLLLCFAACWCRLQGPCDGFGAKQWTVDGEVMTVRAFACSSLAMVIVPCPTDHDPPSTAPNLEGQGLAPRTSLSPSDTSSDTSTPGLQVQQSLQSGPAHSTLSLWSSSLSRLATLTNPSQGKLSPNHNASLGPHNPENKLEGQPPEDATAPAEVKLPSSTSDMTDVALGCPGGETGVKTVEAAKEEAGMVMSGPGIRSSTAAAEASSGSAMEKVEESDSGTGAVEAKSDTLAEEGDTDSVFLASAPAPPQAQAPSFSTPAGELVYPGGGASATEERNDNSGTLSASLGSNTNPSTNSYPNCHPTPGIEQGRWASPHMYRAGVAGGEEDEGAGVEDVLGGVVEVEARAWTGWNGGGGGGGGGGGRAPVATSVAPGTVGSTRRAAGRRRGSRAADGTGGGTGLGADGEECLPRAKPVLRALTEVGSGQNIDSVLFFIKRHPVVPRLACCPPALDQRESACQLGGGDKSKLEQNGRVA